METCSASSALNTEKSCHEKQQIGIMQKLALNYPHREQLEDIQRLKYEEKLRDVEPFCLEERRLSKSLINVCT